MMQRSSATCRAHRSRCRRGDARAVRRGRRRAARRRRRTRGVQGKEEPARRRAADGARRADPRLQTRARRVPGAGPLPVFSHRRRIAVARRHDPPPHRCAMERPAVRLGGGGRDQIQRHRAGQGRGGHRDWRRADEPRGFLIPGGSQGPPAGPRAPGRGARERRLLPLPRRRGRSGCGGGHRHHPARRIGQGRRGDCRGGRARPCHDPDRYAAVPPLDYGPMTTTYPNRATPASRQLDDAATTPANAVKPPYLMAACVSVGALILYIATLAPTTQFWDTSEYLAAAYTLGIPHPPGNPLFVLIAHVFGLLPFMAGYAARINLFAAVTSAVSAGCWFLVADRWLRSFVPALWPRRLVALAGAIVSATAFTVWNQSVVNEKVYTLSLLSIALILWLIVRWDDQPAGEAHDHHLLLIIYLLALTATNHMMGVLVGPVVIILLYPPLKKQRPVSDEERAIEWSQFLVVTSVWLLLLSLGLESGTPVMIAAAIFVAALVYATLVAGNVSFALTALLVAVVGLSVYVYLPIRAGFH